MEICTDLRIVEVAGLPGFHNPFKCEQRAVFDAAVLAALAAQRRRWQFWRPPVQEFAQHLPAEVSERLMRGARDRLGPDELTGCRETCVYHQPDWITMAPDRVRAGQATRRTADRRDDRHRRRTPRADRPDVAAVLLSLADQMAPRLPHLTDGQHRACGLVLAGAERVPVWPGPERLAAEARRLAQHR